MLQNIHNIEHVYKSLPQGRASQQHPRHQTGQPQWCPEHQSPQRRETGSSSSDLEPSFRAPRARKESHSRYRAQPQYWEEFKKYTKID